MPLLRRNCSNLHTLNCSKQVKGPCFVLINWRKKLLKAFDLNTSVMIMSTSPFSVQFSRSVMSNSETAWIAACQASLSITISGIHPNSCPSSRWCHPAISSSVILFSFCLQSFPASESFPMSCHFLSDGQSVSFTQHWFPLGIDWFTSLLSKGLSRVFSNTIRKHQFFST